LLVLLLLADGLPVLQLNWALRIVVVMLVLLVPQGHLLQVVMQDLLEQKSED